MTDGASPLAGARVLVPRPAAGQSPAVVALAAVGARPVLVPLVQTLPPADPTELDDVLLALSAGWYEWLALTSAAAVPVLVDRADEVGTPLPQMLAATGTRVAAVGPGTARALTAEAVAVDLVPRGRASAAALLDAWPAGAGRVLFPRGDLAPGTLADGLRARGHEVDDVVAYRTVPAEPPPADVVADWAAGRIRGALLTSASATRQLVERLGVPPAGTLLVAIGPSTAAEAERLGLPLAGVAGDQTMTGLVAALVDAAARPQPPTQQNHEVTA